MNFLAIVGLVKGLSYHNQRSVINELATIKCRILFPTTGVFFQKKSEIFRHFYPGKTIKNVVFLGGLFEALMTSL